MDAYSVALVVVALILASATAGFLLAWYVFIRRLIGMMDAILASLGAKDPP